MSDATSIPILHDGDTEYGNFNNMQRLVKKLEQRGIAGVCIEDKLFPKTNSFIAGETQALANIDEFVGKIKAGKDAQRDDSFCIVARVEAFIAGWGLYEALRRAEAYRQAGADAILIQSKKNNSSDIEIFMQEWQKYYSTPTDFFRGLGINLIIWANQTLRASIKQIKKITKQIFVDNSLINVEDKIAPLSEVFKLQGEEELRQAEKQYLPSNWKNIKAIVLAASQGIELGEITSEKPKAMIKINGKTILTRLISLLNQIGIKDICVVRGFKKDLVKGSNFRTIDNDIFEKTNDLYSLYLARNELVGDTIILYVDSMFRKYLITDVISAVNSDFAVVIDADICMDNDNKKSDYVQCSQKYTNDFFNTDIKLKSIQTTNDPSDKDGEWIGILYISPRGAQIIINLLNELSQKEDFYKMTVVNLISKIIPNYNVSVVYTKGGWIDIDTAIDIEKAGTF